MLCKLARIGVPSVPSLKVICLGAAVALVLDRKRGPHDVTKPKVPDIDPIAEYI